MYKMTLVKPFCQGTLRFEKNKYTEDDIINMLEFIVDNIFVVFGERFSNMQLAF